ncbi:hypothetical protein BDP27DRAFT_1407013 [Rhodocollybia butyracea]|uniref:Cupredoxin n=1 Tax=Rhodocollybia butyracea TaxID=206335 RepID=A0A9P5TZV6_9AGAR|nr:hypothetical protein BDP27DRAFT_1407013 [Rhodocollybia butyracea]
MRFSTAAAIVSAAASVKAAVFNVQVGANNELAFNPNNITGVQPNDTVNFQFVSKNHSVVQSTFTAPCTAAGVSSGFQNVSDPTASTFPTWTITVEDVSAPLWFFCSQVTATSTHCQSGMVFAINPTAAKNFSTFQAAAIATNGTGPSNPSGSILSGSAGATETALSVSGSASETALSAATAGSASSTGSTTGAPSSQTSSPSGAMQLMAGSSFSVLAVLGLVAGLAL